MDQNHDQEQFDEDFISKTQIKKEAADITDFGKKLSIQPQKILDKLPLNGELIDAIKLAKNLKQGSAAKRHFKFLGKLLRETENLEEIQSTLEQLLAPHHQQVKQFYQAEKWRDQLSDGGQEHIEAFIQEHPSADRQKLRQLTRQIQKEAKEGKPPKEKRQQFKYISEFFTS